MQEGKLIDPTNKERNMTFRTTEYLFRKLSFYAHKYGLKKSDFIRRLLEKAIIDLEQGVKHE